MYHPSHHANSSRSLFQNPWMVAESTAAPPPHDSRPTLRKSTSYWPGFPAGFQLPTLERVRASVSAPYPHPPVKVVKPDWGIHHPTATDSPSDTVPNLKATWLGHAVRPLVTSSPLCGLRSLMQYLCLYGSFFVPSTRVSSSSSRVSRLAHKMNLLASCSIPSSQSARGRLLGWAFDVAYLLLARSQNYQSSNSWSTPITSASSRNVSPRAPVLYSS